MTSPSLSRGQAPDPRSMMRAAVVAAPGRVEVVDVPVPEPGEGEVRVRLEGCGVCASNLGPWAGPAWMRFPAGPGELGHEGWGVIDALGAGVAGLPIGQRVAVLSFNAYAQYDIASADAVVPLPPALDGRAFPGEPLGCAMNILARSWIAAGQTVAVVGAGFIGTLLVQLAAAQGARVIAVSRRPFAREKAREAGAAVVLDPADPGAVLDAVRAMTDGRLCDRVIEAGGVQATLDLAASLTGERGRLVIAGYHQDGPRTVNMQEWNWRGLDVVNAHERDPAIYAAGMRAAVDAVVSGHLEPDGLYTHRYPLDRLGEALDATRDRPDGFMKALVIP